LTAAAASPTERPIFPREVPTMSRLRPSRPFLLGALLLGCAASAGAAVKETRAGIDWANAHPD
jgi:hypothetical protein